MKIYGDSSNEFNKHVNKPGMVFGSNDVLQGHVVTVHYLSGMISRFFTPSTSTFTREFYIHIPKNVWSNFTMEIRSFLPWWKTAYLDKQDGSGPSKILVCTWSNVSTLPKELKNVIGKSLFLVNLIINQDCYDEECGKEFFRFKGLHGTHRLVKIDNVIGDRYFTTTNDVFCHIYRPRSLFSTLKYNFLKRFSNSWEEVTVKTGQLSEKVLIEKSDKAVIRAQGLIA